MGWRGPLARNSHLRWGSRRLRGMRLIGFPDILRKTIDFFVLTVKFPGRTRLADLHSLTASQEKGGWGGYLLSGILADNLQISCKLRGNSQCVHARRLPSKIQIPFELKETRNSLMCADCCALTHPLMQRLLPGWRKHGELSIPIMRCAAVIFCKHLRCGVSTSLTRACLFTAARKDRSPGCVSVGAPGRMTVGRA